MPAEFDPHWTRPDAGEGTGFALDDLLTSAPAHQVAAERHAHARDQQVNYSFDALRHKGPARPPIPLSAADYFIDFLTPFLIFVMMLAFILYLLDIRYMFTEKEDVRLRMVSIFFVMGIVALNRLINRDGREQSLIYMLGMGVVVTLFTASTSGQGGAFVKGALDQMGIDVALNLAVVAGLWWIINRLTRECCIDRSSASGEIGLWQGALMKVKESAKEARELPRRVAQANRREPELPYILQNTVEAYDPLERDRAGEAAAIAPPAWHERMPATHPGAAIFYVSIPVMITFILGYPVLANGGPVMITAGYAFVGVYTLSALGLLMLTSLRGLRGYCQERHVPVPPSVSTFWMGFGALLMAIVLMLGLLGPSPGVPAPYYIANREYDLSARHADLWDYHENQTGEAQQDPQQGAEEQEPSTEPESTTQTAEPDGQQYSQDSQGSTQPPRSSPPEVETASPLLNLMEVAPIARYIVWAIVGLGALLAIGFALFAFLRAYASARLERPGIISALRRFLEGLRAAARVPGARPWRVRVSRQIANSPQYQNPLSSDMTVRDKVRYSFDALCALALDVGQPRNPDHTPLEFLEHFPTRLESLRESATEVIRLFTIAHYSNFEMQPHIEDRLRAFWRDYDEVRRRVVR